MLRIADVPNKGIGVVATTQITAGTRILSEAPVAYVPPNTYGTNLANHTLSQLQKLDDSSKKAFFALRNDHKEIRPIQGIVKTNAMPLGMASSAGGVFLQCSRFNHSCTPNAAYHWNGDAKQERVHAIRDVDSGEEITVCYLSDEQWALPKQERQMHLLKEFRFSCCCVRCEDTDKSEGRDSDRRRKRLAEIDRNVGDGKLIVANPGKALALCREALGLLKEEKEASPRSESVYYDAFQICVCHGDLARAKAFVSLAADAKRLWKGEDASDLGEMEAFVRKPESHYSAFQTKKWNTASKDALSPSSPEFEKWLWRRAG